LLKGRTVTLDLTKFHLHGRLYTWSNEQTHPTLARIDRVFACLQWCDMFPHHRLWALSSSCSDHSPLTLISPILAWSIIKGDIMNAFNAFWSLDFRSFYLVNQAYMALLRMRRDAEDVKDFRPICLIYNISKLIIKTLSLKLAPHMQNLVRSNQTAFIKDHAIHDNLVAVQAMTKLLHA
jgi:hypothetical protein